MFSSKFIEIEWNCSSFEHWDAENAMIVTDISKYFVEARTKRSNKIIIMLKILE